MLTGLISSGSVHCLAHVGRKLPQCGNFDQILAANSRPTVYATLTRQISFESVYCVTFQRKKTHNFWQMLTLEGLLYCTQPPLPIRTKSRVPCTKVLSQSISGFGIFTPFDRSRRTRQACDVSFSNFATQEKL